MSRREIRDAGMTLIFDAKRTNPPPQLYKAMMEFQVSGAQRKIRVRREKQLSWCVMMLQEQTGQAVNSVVLLVDKESSQRPEKCPGISVSLFTLSIHYYNELRVI